MCVSLDVGILDFAPRPDQADVEHKWHRMELVGQKEDVVPLIPNILNKCSIRTFSRFN